MVAATAILSVGLLWSLYGRRFHAGTDGSDTYNRPMADKIHRFDAAGKPIR